MKNRTVGDCLFLSFLLFIVCSIGITYAANLDDLYQPLLKKNRFIYKGEFNYFRLEEDAIHGSASYDKFDSQPQLYSFNNSLRFSPLPFLDFELGLKEIFSDSYNRSLYDLSGDLAATYDYELDNFRDYSVGLRIRKEPIEVYLNFLEKRQKGNWNYRAHPNPPNYFAYIRTHYEDIKTGLRYLSECQEVRDKTNLSKLRRPLISDGRINIEAELEYKYGKLRRRDDAATFFYNYYHTLGQHVISKFTLRYGLGKNLELESGLFFTTPFKYKYEYRLYYPAGTSSFIVGTYKLKDNFYFPLKLRYRPKDNFEIMLGSDFNLINQRLDYWQKNTDESITDYPSKELTYFNTKPTIKLTYLHSANKQIQEDEFSSLTKQLLLKGQFLIEFQYQRDITQLNKNSDNGPQNIIDPYNVFLYPLDYFLVGSEYATFIIGNYSKYATNVLPQNYYLLRATFLYGLTDHINMGMKLGYSSDSCLHHFTLNDLASRAYKFKPHGFLDFLCDWQLTKNSLLSFRLHFVPNYTTYLDSSGSPQQFKSRNRYFKAGLALRVLF